MKPSFSITIGGKDRTAAVQSRLLKLEIVDQAGVKSDRLTLDLDDRDQLLEMPATGEKIKVSLGIATTEPMGEWVVDEVEVEGRPNRMVVRATAADLTGGIKAPKERSFHHITLRDVAFRVAADNDLTPEVDASAASVDLGHIDQNESDMALLTRLCADRGYVFKVGDGKLVLAKQGSGKTSSGKTIPTIRLESSQCSRWGASITRRDKFVSCKAYWQDPEEGTRREVVINDGDPQVVLRTTYRTEEEASNAAYSRLNGINAGTGKLRIEGLTGNPQYIAEAKLIVQGFRDGIDGEEWTISEVRHVLDANGYVCSISAEIGDKGKT